MELETIKDYHNKPLEKGFYKRLIDRSIDTTIIMTISKNPLRAYNFDETPPYFVYQDNKGKYMIESSEGNVEYLKLDSSKDLYKIEENDIRALSTTLRIKREWLDNKLNSMHKDIWARLMIRD